MDQISFHPIIFRSNEELPERVDGVYSQLIKEIIVRLGFDPNNFALHEASYTHPLLYRPSGSLKEAVAQFLEKNISDDGTGQKILADATSRFMIYIDEEYPIAASSNFSLLSYLSNLIANSKIAGIPVEKRFVLVLPSLPKEEEAEYGLLTNMKAQCKENEIIIIDAEGNSINTGFNFKEIFSQHAPKLKEDAKASLELKLIRRVGHFYRGVIDKEGKKNEWCHRYFYDGSKCIKEIVEIFKQRVVINKVNGIILHCPESRWLREAIRTLCVDMAEVPLIDISNILKEEKRTEEIKKFKKLDQSSEPAIIFDLIDTGVTFNRVMDLIKGAIPEVASKSKIYSLLATREKNQREEKIIIEEGKLKINNWMVDYISPVIQRKHPKANCEMCEIGLEYTLPQQENTLQLSSYDFWELSKEAGFKSKEDDVPSYRRPMKLVPDFIKMIENNGPFLVKKISDHLKEKNIEPSNFFFICPDEGGAIIISKNIRKLIPIAGIIYIPRPVLEKISLKQFNLEEVRKEERDKDWFRKLEYIKEESPKGIIVFDEFTVSGGTLKDITTLLSYFDLDDKIKCFFPLVIFSDLNNIHNKELFCLYSFNLYQSNPAYS